MKDTYEFISYWEGVETSPPNATRCLVTDGDLVVIATHLTDSDKTTWMFQGLIDGGKGFNVIGWMPLPRPMKKPIDKDETIVVNN